MDRREFLKPDLCVPSGLDGFQFSTFFSVALNVFWRIIASEPFSSPCNFFSILFIPSSLLFPFPYFTPKLFSFLCSRSLLCLRAFFYFLVKFPYIILLSPILIVVLDSVLVYFKSSFLSPIYFDLSLSSNIVRQVYCFILVFLSQHIPVFFSFLCIFVIYSNFFTCPSSLIFHRDFVFPFGFQRKTLILSQCHLVYLVITCSLFLFLP